MTVKKCDRCGAIYEPQKYETDEHNISSCLRISKQYSYSSAKEEMYDLCPACTKSLEKWLKKEK